jgi:acyl-CoA dehydrogenase
VSHSLTDDQQTIRENVLKLCARFGDDYWLARDRDGEYPEAFKQAMADGGWTGLTLPVAYGGAGLGITEGAVMMQAIAESGAGMSGASAIHSNIFAPKMID